uniref:Retroviral nucleocapsid Gag protein p24 C-terminal domain-containing protein n=1 Tax=Serinus canaria TaxID=9135 RepID=A0A8C9UE69_SERCA
MIHQETNSTNWAEIRRKALKEGDFDMASIQLMTTKQGRQNVTPKWRPLTYDVIKDLRQAVKEDGLGSVYFQKLLKITFYFYDLLPHDCRGLVSLIVPELQFQEWDVRWRRALAHLRNRYAGGPHAALTLAQLAGDEPHDSPEDQAAQLPPDVIADIKEAARKAILQIEPAGTPEGFFTEVKQGPTEPFTSFVHRLTQAVDRQESNEDLKPHLVRTFAFGNANAECKRVINIEHGLPTVAEMMEACSKVGTPQHMAEILAGVCVEQVRKLLQEQNKEFSRMLAELHPTFQQGNSTEAISTEFTRGPSSKHGKYGHKKENCPEPTKNVEAPGLCQRCGKGKHQAKECYSKRDVEGRALPLPRNSKKSARRHRATTQGMAMAQPGTPQGTQPSGNVNDTPSAGPPASSPEPELLPRVHSGNWQLPSWYLE